MNVAYPESKESLWSLVRAPVIWAVHFMSCYVMAAIYCAKLGSTQGRLDPARIAIALMTLIAVSVLAWTAWRGCRRMRGAPPPHGGDDAKARTAFLGYLDLLLSLLSLIAVLMTALPALFIGTCE